MIEKPPNTTNETWDVAPEGLARAETGVLSGNFGTVANERTNAEEANAIELNAVNSTLVGTIRTDGIDEDEKNDKLRSAKAGRADLAIGESSNQLYNISRRDYSNANSDVFGDTVFTNEEGLLVDDEGNYVSHEQLTQIGDNEGVCYGFRTVDGDLTNDMLEYLTLDHEEGMDIDPEQIPEHIRVMVADIVNPTAEDYENAAYEYLKLGEAHNNATILDVPTSRMSEYFTNHANWGDLVNNDPKPAIQKDPALDTLEHS